MENASKALIIAGAILLAILIISLGILIFNQASSIVNNNAMSSVEITQFNTQFTQYSGNQRGSVVSNLLQSVIASNALEENAERKVSVYYGDGTGTALIDASGTNAGTSINQTNYSTNIKSGNTYSISCEYSTGGANTGLVNVIRIKSSTSSAT